MYPLDRRRRLVAKIIYEKLSSCRKTAALIGVSYSSVSRWVKNIQPKERKRPNIQYKSEIIVECIKTAIKLNPFISIVKLQKLILETLKVKVSYPYSTWFIISVFHMVH
jgi:transposase